MREVDTLPDARRGARRTLDNTQHDTQVKPKKRKTLTDGRWGGVVVEQQEKTAAKMPPARSSMSRAPWRVEGEEGVRRETVSHSPEGLHLGGKDLQEQDFEGLPYDDVEQHGRGEGAHPVGQLARVEVLGQEHHEHRAQHQPNEVHHIPHNHSPVREAHGADPVQQGEGAVGVEGVQLVDLRGVHQAVHQRPHADEEVVHHHQVGAVPGIHPDPSALDHEIAKGGIQGRAHGDVDLGRGGDDDRGMVDQRRGDGQASGRAGNDQRGVAPGQQLHNRAGLCHSNRGLHSVVVRTTSNHPFRFRVRGADVQRDSFPGQRVHVDDPLAGLDSQVWQNGLSPLQGLVGLEFVRVRGSSGENSPQRRRRSRRGRRLPHLVLLWRRRSRLHSLWPQLHGSSGIQTDRFHPAAGLLVQVGLREHAEVGGQGVLRIRGGARGGGGELKGVGVQHGHGGARWGGRQHHPWSRGRSGGQPSEFHQQLVLPSDIARGNANLPRLELGLPVVVKILVSREERSGVVRHPVPPKCQIHGFLCGALATGLSGVPADGEEQRGGGDVVLVLFGHRDPELPQLLLRVHGLPGGGPVAQERGD
eukprot:RCo029329